MFFPVSLQKGRVIIVFLSFFFPKGGVRGSRCECKLQTSIDVLTLKVELAYECNKAHHLLIRYDLGCI